MYWRRVAFGGLGAVAALFALGLLFVPGVGSGPAAVLLDVVETAGAERVLLVAGLGLLAYLGVALRMPGGERQADTHRFEERTEGAVDGITTGEQRITASELDEGIEAAIEGGGEALVVLRHRLRTTAASVYADVTARPTDAAEDAIAGGQWCRDPVAAAFLAGPAGPSHPVSGKLRLLIAPERERRRRIERTISAIEDLEYA